MAVVGPLTSLALAAVAWLAWLAIGGGYSPLAAVLRYLANVNLLLALFNLIPGFPLGWRPGAPVGPLDDHR